MSLNVELILKLIDRASGPLRGVQDRLGQLGATLDRTGRAQVAWADAAIERNNARMAGLQSEAMGVAALGASLVALTEPAIQAEAQMAEVAKVVDFEGADGFALLGKEIRALVTSGGLASTAKEVTEIVAAGARLGILGENLPDDEMRRQLLEFAEAATKMSVAFGIGAEDAGTTLAVWRQNLGLNMEQALALADTVNLLGNSMATSEANISAVITKMGSGVKLAGLTAGEIAALSATMLAGDNNVERAGTAMKNFTNALTIGEAATDRQRKAYARLGIDAVELAKLMQTDASGAIMSVLRALQGVEDWERSSVLTQLFGEEAKSVVATLLQNTELLEQTFGRAADSAQFLGLMEEEYQRQAATTRAQRTRMFEHFNALAVVIGNQVLPTMNSLMETIMPVVSRVMEWVEANPVLVEQLLKVAAGVLAFKAGSLALRFVLFGTVGQVLGLVRGVGRAMVVIPGLARAMAALRPLRWATLIPKLVWSTFVGLIPWLALAGRLAWTVLIKPLIWTALLIPKIGWAALGGPLVWSALISSLKWLSFIPAIGWVAIAASVGLFAWKYFGLKDLPWKDYIEDIDWSYWAFGKWWHALHKLDWNDLIDPVNLASFINLNLRRIGSPEGAAAAAEADRARDGAPARPEGYDPGLANDGSMSLPPAYDPPARDAGGPLRRAMAYLVGERGPELFVPGTDGAILPGRMTRMLAGASAAAAGLAAEAQRMAQGLDMRPAAAGALRGAAGGALGGGFQVGQIVIQAAPGQDPEAIARAVMARLKREAQAAGRGALHDGGIA